jgi:ATP synthase protein I
MMQSASGGGDPDYRDIKRRLDRLGDELKQAKQDEAGQQGATPPDVRGRALSWAFRLATELVAGVFVGGAMGWLLDRWLGTAPFLLIVFLLLGIAAGLLNSIRAAQRMQKEL